MNQKTITINEMLHGKMRGMELNRTVNDEEGRTMDIIAGPFFLAYKIF